MSMEILRLEGLQVAESSGDGRWNRIFPAETTRYREDFPDGITFDARFFGSIIDVWSSMGKPQLPIDYAHKSDGIAAGWITDLRETADGLEARIEWTSAAKAAIVARELQFLSPTFARSSMHPATGETVGPTLYGAALLNTPFLYDLPRVEAGRHTGAKKMEFTKRLAALIGIPETSTEDEVAKAVEAACAAQKKATAMSADADRAIELQRTGAVELASVKAERDTLSAKAAALEAELRNLAVDGMVRDATARGVANPSGQVEKALKLSKGDLAAAKEIMSMVPSTVALGEVGVAATESPKGTAALDIIRASAKKIAETEGRSFGDALELAMSRDPETAKRIRK